MNKGTAMRELNISLLERDVSTEAIARIIKYFPYESITLTFSHAKTGEIRYTVKGTVSEQFHHAVQTEIEKSKRRRKRS